MIQRRDFLEIELLVDMVRVKYNLLHYIKLQTKELILHKFLKDVFLKTHQR